MKHLIIFAHPNGQNSLNQAILQKVLEVSEQNGVETVVRDLYRLNFNPVLSQQEIQSAFQGIVPQEIQQEQQLIQQAELITLIYPIWWMGFPAILKGYIDRVFTYGFAYKTENGLSVGLLSDKKMQHFITYGNSPERYERLGFTEAFKHCLVDGLFNFCDITDIQHCLFGEVYGLSEQAMQQLFEQVAMQTQKNLTALLEKNQ